MIKQALILHHRLRVKHRVYRSVNFVHQCEHLPSNFAIGMVEHTRVEPTENLGRVVRCVGVSDGCLECRGEVVQVERMCRTGETRPECVPRHQLVDQTQTPDNLPKRFHEMVGKVPVAEHKVAFERFHVVDQLKFVEEYFEEPLTRYTIRRVDGSFEPSDVTVF